MMSIVIGVTGGISTGKSFVTSAFKKLGARVFDADVAAHSLLQKGNVCYSKILKAFGPDILTKEEIDRKKLARIVFQNKVKLRKLERIIHPEVEKEIVQEINRFKKRGKEKILILDVPLLFEAGLDAKVDYAIVVKSNVSQQMERSTKTLGRTKAECRRRIKAQMPLRDKIRYADIVIDNSKTKIETIKKVKEIWQKISKRIKK